MCEQEYDFQSGFGTLKLGSGIARRGARQSCLHSPLWTNHATSLIGQCAVTKHAVFFRSIILLLTLSACTSVRPRPTTDRYQLDVQDNPAELRFDIVLKSNDDRFLCVNVEDWPDSNGSLMVDNAELSLRVDGELRRARGKLMSMYCPGGCGELRIAPRGELRGFISYAVFDDPPRIASASSRELVFNEMPSYCVAR